MSNSSNNANSRATPPSVAYATHSPLHADADGKAPFYLDVVMNRIRATTIPEPKARQIQEIVRRTGAGLPCDESLLLSVHQRLLPPASYSVNTKAPELSL